MKYKFLLKGLRALIFFKRAVWWMGSKFTGLFVSALKLVLRPVLYINYRISYFLKRLGLRDTASWIFKRGFLQILFFFSLLLASMTQTKLSSANLYVSGQKTIAYELLGQQEVDYAVEEIFASDPIKYDSPSWREGSLGNDNLAANPLANLDQDLAAVEAGGLALSKPYLIPGSSAISTRSGMVNYTVEPGDSLGTIAESFGVSIATVLWENNLTVRSIIRPGNILKIPPTSGIMHTVKKNDTLKKIAALYAGNADEIVKFNSLKNNGANLAIGDKIMVPGGVKPRDQTPQNVRTAPTLYRAAAPAGSSASPSASGFIWPSKARTITQYFGWSHHALDIAGPFASANYASKAGTVEKSQCGWNSGYGCVVIINHGGGLKTLYGHNSTLLVKVGDKVTAGQTIALMGNTGKVRGKTGIHVHFEVIKNGVRVNPLGYVR